jgi:hypothetical protein
MSNQFKVIQATVQKLENYKKDLISIKPAYEDSPKDYYEMTGKISAIDTCITILEFEIKNIDEREKEADQVSENKNFSMGYTAPRFHP